MQVSSPKAQLWLVLTFTSRPTVVSWSRLHFKVATKSDTEVTLQVMAGFNDAIIAIKHHYGYINVRWERHFSAGGSENVNTDIDLGADE